MEPHGRSVSRPVRESCEGIAWWVRGLLTVLLGIFATLCFAFMLPAVRVSAADLDADTVSRIRPSVKALDLSRPPTIEELMAAGQFGGLLYPTRDAIPVRATAKSTDAELTRGEKINLSFANAIQHWNEHEYDRAVELFKAHVEEFPDSPWASEAVLHVGCDARYNGRFSEAEDRFDWVIRENTGSSHYGSRMLLNKARQRLAILRVLQNDIAASLDLFAAMKRESPDWRHRTYASSWMLRLPNTRSDRLTMLNCGADALALILRRDGRPSEAEDVARMIPPTPDGQSLADLAAIASEFGYTPVGLRIAADDLSSLPLPAIVHLTGAGPATGGHYWVLESVQNEDLQLADPQSGGRYHQTRKEFSREWDGQALVMWDIGALPGTRLDRVEMQGVAGGCCGAPPPLGDLGATGENGGERANGPEGPGCGAPTWSVNMHNLNLYVTDTPIWYRSPFGPQMAITLSYNSQSAIAHNEVFGNKWQFNFATYVIEDPAGTATVFMPDGRRDQYFADGTGSYVQPHRVFNTLVKIAAHHFELRFPDDTVYVYTRPTSSLQPLLTEIRDANGQSLTFAYDSLVQLTTITDPQGRSTTLTHNGDGLVTRVTDPFGRFAEFVYDADRNLVKITDMGGYWSSFTYDEDIYLTSIEDPRGVWDFWVEPSDDSRGDPDEYPPPGGVMWGNYRITVTNPLGGTEEYFYYGGCDDVTCTGQSWYVSPRDYIPWQSETINNFRSPAPKTRYYSHEIPQRRHIGEVVYPDESSVRYGFDASGNRTSVTDSEGHTWNYTHNDKGSVTSATSPNGSAALFTYDANGVDLLQVEDANGTVSYTYDTAHHVTSATDRLGNTTTFTHNSFGQVTSRTDPLGVVTMYAYDAGQRLAQVIVDGTLVEVFTHDPLGRVVTHTSPSGMVRSFTYDDLDHLISIVFPEGRSTEFTYEDCCPFLLAAVSERSGKTTTYSYDALKRKIRITDPDSGTERYDYDENGNVVGITDPNGNTTRFEYDVVDRPIHKIFADGTQLSYTYGHAGLLESRTNARGVVASHTYDENHNLTGVSYSDATPSVVYQYDATHRLIERQDGAGTFAFAYDAESRLTTVDGPWSNDTLTYTYDALGRRVGLAVEGSAAVAHDYDTLGRLTEIARGASTHTFTYPGASHFPSGLARPGGGSTTYVRDILDRLTGVSNQDDTPQVINQFDYQYDHDELRTSETVTNGPAIAPFVDELVTYSYNNVNQRESQSTPTVAYLYDADGNLTSGITPEGYPFDASYDAENRLSSIQYTDGGGTLHRSEFTYGADSFLARSLDYENAVPTDDTRFVRDGALPIQERDGANTVARELLWSPIAAGGIGGLLAVLQGGQEYYPLFDGKGNVTAVTDSTHSIVSSYGYSPFGELQSETGSFEQPFRFSTKRYNKGLGLSYFGRRFYSPPTGRWMSRDPAGENAGLNLYSYARNNPVSYVDPCGLTLCSEVMLNTATGDYSFHTASVEDWARYFDRIGLTKRYCMSDCTRGAKVCFNPKRGLWDKLGAEVRSAGKSCLGSLWGAAVGFGSDDRAPYEFVYPSGAVAQVVGNVRW